MSLNKSQLLRRIEASLYTDIHDKLNRMFNEIHLAHQRLVIQSGNGFWFKGVRHGLITKVVIQPLHPALHEFMESYLSQSEDMRNEQAYVSSYIQSVLNQCTEESQLYYHFPSGLHSILRDEGLDETPTTNLGMVPAIDFNQKGKELLLARMMLNMTGN